MMLYAPRNPNHGPSVMVIGDHRITEGKGRINKSGIIIHEKGFIKGHEMVMKGSRINQCNTIHLFKLKTANLKLSLFLFMTILDGV